MALCYTSWSRVGSVIDTLAFQLKACNKTSLGVIINWWPAGRLRLDSRIVRIKEKTSHGPHH